MRTAGDSDAGNRDDGRRLVLLRHAKSDYPEETADHDRPLARRGRRAAPVVGRWLAESGYVPDAVVCSTARRARETWELASAALENTGLTAPPARYEPRVYEATVLSLLMLVREFDPGWETALIVGHNPGLAELTLGLAEQYSPGGQPPQTPPTYSKERPEPPPSFPTAFVAVLQLPGPWAAAEPGKARLVTLAVPAKS